MSRGRAADHAAVRAADRGADGRDGFRPDLEGLRAVAVVLVVLFHAGLLNVGGGYVGVDVFFVLSGFLITGLIHRELERTGTVSLSAFYARRARRLLPAAVVALVATLVASVLFLPPLAVPDVAGDAAAAALYVSNMRFAFQATDYLQAAAAPSPLLHYWSLGVEEQFYLFWPALLLLVARGGRGTIGRLGALVAVAFGLSLVLSLVLTGIAQPWAFFTLPARAWELALGAGIALAAARGLAPPRRASAPLGIAGIACIVVAGFAFDTSTAFPGLAALLPTAGAALVIAAGLRRPAAAAPLRDAVPIHIRLLSLPPMRWLGRISYSLYLWHWPILVIPAAAREADLSLRTRVALVGLAVVAAALSQRFVEEPIRRGRFVGLRTRRSLAIAGAATVIVAGISGSLMPGGPLSAPFTLAGTGAVDGATIADDVARALGSPGASPGSPVPSAGPTAGSSAGPTAGPSGPAPSIVVRPRTVAAPVPSNLTPSLARARTDLAPVYADGCQLTFDEVTPGTCAFGDTSSSTAVVLVGDSHAAEWFPALVRAADKRHWRLVSLTKAACAPADIQVWSTALNRAYTECSAWREQVLARIAAERPALVVVSMSRGYRLAVGGRPVKADDRRPAMQAALTAYLRSIAAVSPRVALIADTPWSAFDPPLCLSAHLDDASACATPLAEATDEAFLELEARAARDAGASLVDGNPWICPSEPCPVVIGHVLVYRDRDHLTETFAAALADYLAAALPPLGP